MIFTVILWSLALGASFHDNCMETDNGLKVMYRFEAEEMESFPLLGGLWRQLDRTGEEGSFPSDQSLLKIANHHARLGEMPAELWEEIEDAYRREFLSQEALLQIINLTPPPASKVIDLLRQVTPGKIDPIHLPQLEGWQAVELKCMLEPSQAANIQIKEIQSETDLRKLELGLRYAPNVHLLAMAIELLANPQFGVAAVDMLGAIPDAALLEKALAAIPKNLPNGLKIVLASSLGDNTRAHPHLRKLIRQQTQALLQGGLQDE